MSTLTVPVCRVEFANGVSKKSGTPKPYSFARVIYSVKSESFVNDEHNIQKAGSEEKEIAMLFDMNLFLRLADAVPCTMELTLSADPKNPARNIVSDFVVLPD